MYIYTIIVRNIFKNEGREKRNKSHNKNTDVKNENCTRKYLVAPRSVPHFPWGANEQIIIAAVALLCFLPRAIGGFFFGKNDGIARYGFAETWRLHFEATRFCVVVAVWWPKRRNVKNTRAPNK